MPLRYVFKKTRVTGLVKQVIVFNATGSEIKGADMLKSSPQLSVQLPRLSPGLYLLQVHAAEGSFSKRFVVE